MYKYYLGLDLGKKNDYSAFVVLENLGGYRERGDYHCRHIERFNRGTYYPDVVGHIKEFMSRKPLYGNMKLVVDATGVGEPVVDSFKKEGLHPIAITITGGNTVTKDGNNYNVPKRDLVSNLVVLFQSDKLKIADKLPYRDTLVQELSNFDVKITLNGNDIYGAWKEGEHDDLVLALALASWFAERVGGVEPRATFLG